MREAVQPHIYMRDRRSDLVTRVPTGTKMSGCAFELAQNSPLRTTLVDEVTGHAKYQIDTPLRIVGSVTRIRKFDLPPSQPLPLIQSGEASPDDDDDPTDTGKKKGKWFKWNPVTGEELPETDDELARIHWKWFLPCMINFGGKMTDRREFLPRTGRRNR